MMKDYVATLYFYLRKDLVLAFASLVVIRMCASLSLSVYIYVYDDV